MKRFFITVFAVALCIAGYSQRALTANTLTTEGEAENKATINDIAWIAGHWTGESFGGIGEEFWSEPMGGAMMGCYRMVKNDTVSFYEVMLIREVEGSLLLQIKHFNRDLTGWEEKDESEDFRFIKREGKRVYFDGFTFEDNGTDKFTIYAAFEGQEKGTYTEYIFPYRRKGAVN